MLLPQVLSVFPVFPQCSGGSGLAQGKAGGSQALPVAQDAAQLSHRAKPALTPAWKAALGKGLTWCCCWQVGGQLSHRDVGAEMGVRCSLFNLPCQGQSEMPHPCATGSRAKQEDAGCDAVKPVMSRNKSSLWCQGRSFISQPAKLGGAELQRAGANESGQGGSRCCCVLGWWCQQGEDSIVHVSLQVQSPALGLPLRIHQLRCLCSASS